MPIKIPNGLPAAKTLADENIFTIHTSRALTQDIRPLKILVLNLMPTKIVTETQFARLLGNTPLQVELELLTTRSHISKNASEEHMLTFYKTFDEIKERKFDGMVITGAPVEDIPFCEIEYREELCGIFDWCKSHVTSTIYICWTAQAALYYYYGIKCRLLPHKLFGVYEHRIDHKGSILFRGFDDRFMVPHSRHTAVDRTDIESVPQLKILASGEKTGVYAISTDAGRQIFLTGHSEYDTDTLHKEYLRDKNAGIQIDIPENYYPGNDPTRPPLNTWRSSANLLFSNWLNYFVYQSTPYDLNQIK